MVSDWLLSIERSPLPTWVRESGSIWAYPTVLTLHTLGLGILVGVSAFIAMRAFGLGAMIPSTAVRALRPWFWGGLFVNACTGLLLFAADASAKSIQLVFWLKLTAIFAALLLTYRLQLRLSDAPSALAHPPLVLASASLLCWATAITAGRFMAYL
jgi:hypothetical protein